MGRLRQPDHLDRHSEALLGYAGQYTDTETGYQYLRARYYDPKTTQFLTLDPLVAQTGEPYGYASSNPVVYRDETGAWPHVVLAAAIGGVVGGAAGGIGHIATHGFSDPRGFGAAVAGGAVNGAVTSGCIVGTGQVTLCGAAGGVAGGFVEGHLSGEGYSLVDAGTDAAIGGASAYLAGVSNPWVVPETQYKPYKMINLIQPGTIAKKMYRTEGLSAIYGFVFGGCETMATSPSSSGAS